MFRVWTEVTLFRPGTVPVPVPVLLLAYCASETLSCFTEVVIFIFGSILCSKQTSLICRNKQNILDSVSSDVVENF